MAEPQAVLAFLYDFDKTLCTTDMQEYTFIPRVGLDPDTFWKESNAMSVNHKMDRILSYMHLMLKKANAAEKSIKREDFVALGKDLELFPGVEDWFARLNAMGEAQGVTVEHYIISSGLREIIEGSSIFRCFREVFACEFLYDVNGVACWPKNVVNYTTKTQFLYRVNKGILDISNDVDLNRYVPEDERPVPFRNMVYLGDGLTDVPCMRLVKANGGSSIAVYQPGHKGKVNELLEHGRVDFLAPADYSAGSELEALARSLVQKMSITDALVRKSRAQAQELRG